ncbi:23S rRNA pseudouridine(2604) synthase RluF [Clostridium gasigenes]|uniref:23S rRNA pseudouridine(2604) synthase RluF n=1 Tax=Clostridium gasigenes TaxID=94869 RepID=UPI0014386123|nr:23S rRNA pseudouridine(2604) synthase RluF [Clostridium gasigenes]MBU3104745.1 23S rRNA pseudouridine(2604) synthase RluF [Clostridium gasigenes]MBU3108535.1 23S rRNA pseudouridine(2604) synthase RluF [Clostridium gasigenes]MBU3137935.1 23S rRNA pseudouridine(2604) synthase RluF [Clostridium gasigenes]NKF07849.1 23S rRNA pseudouridine(2604) synthase RluF [Clostridium gasigenes]QSW20385.1 23S rRNA pseudouridine(2604) synthase RluF [Clostridium gasigenes]
MQQKNSDKNKSKNKPGNKNFTNKKYNKKSNVDKEPIIVHTDRNEEIRLNKYISETGICSRRQADNLVEMGRVTVDDVKATMGIKVTKGQVVKVDGKSINKVENLVYIVLNKPVGITCTTEKNVKGNIIDFVKHRERIFPIGRLDKDSQGLILLTNDGDIVNKILRAGNNHEKEYVVTVDKMMTHDFINKMGSGVEILGTVTKECLVERQGKFMFKINLTEGMNRQIRRMTEALGYKVVKLERIRIMNINISKLRMGQWRDLTSRELIKLNELISESAKTL